MISDKEKFFNLDMCMHMLSFQGYYKYIYLYVIYYLYRDSYMLKC